MTIKLDPIFDMPEDLNGLEYKEEGVILDDIVEDSGDEPVDEDLGIPSAMSGDEPLLPPDNCTIIGQTVRIDADGKSVVDVVVEVDGSQGALEYDLKVSPR